MRTLQLLMTFLLLSVNAVWALEFYVAPTGSSKGDGSIDRPWDLHTAFNHPVAVKPGDMIWLREGTYKGPFLSNLKGTVDAPIIMRNYKNERVIIDAAPFVILHTDIAIGTSGKSLVLEVSNAAVLKGGTFVIDTETFYITKTQGNIITVIRGWSGTIPVAHAKGSLIVPWFETLTVQGAYVWFWGLEFTNSDTKGRILSIPAFDGNESNRSDSRHGGINVTAQGIKMINLIIHDGGSGVFMGHSAIDAEVNGAIIYYNGWQGPGLDRGHGHGMYIQNDQGNKIVKDVISFDNHATGMKLFGYAAYGKNLTFDGVTAFNNGSIATLSPTQAREPNLYVGTGTHPLENITIKNVMLFHPENVVGNNSTIGWTTDGNTGLMFTDNYLVGGNASVAVHKWKSGSVTGNTFYTTKLETWSSQSFVIASMATGYPSSVLNWDKNYYYTTVPLSSGFQYLFHYTSGIGEVIRNRAGGGIISYDQPKITGSLGQGWKQWTGYDANSTYTSSRPTGVKVFVRPNQYENGRANITIFNWDAQTVVKADVSSVLNKGDSYELHNAQDFYGDVIKGEYVGVPIEIPMTGRTVAQPVGVVATAPQSHFPTFGVFVLIKGPAKPSLIVGDVSGDGYVTDVDVNLVSEYALDLKAFDLKDLQAIDISNDGRVTMYDAALISRYTKGLIVSLEEI